MKVFLSWSGLRSRHVAEALREWLPYIIHSIEPWISTTDIDPGSRWNPEIGRQLESTDFGILCLTRENIDAPWILFEAGTLAKSLVTSHVCPYLIDIAPTDLKGPLAQFQALRSNKQDTWRLISQIHSLMSNIRLNEGRLRKTFERFWPDLEESLSKIPESDKKLIKERTDRSILEELLEDVRSIKRLIARSERIETFRKIENAGKDIELHIDAMEIGVGKRIPFYFNLSQTFQYMLDTVWDKLVSNRFSSFTYGKFWTLVDEAKGITYTKLGKIDERLLQDLGFHDNQTLKIKTLGSTEVEK